MWLDAYGRPATLVDRRKLGQHPNDDAAILCPTFAGIVRGDWLLLTVANGVHPVKRNLVALVEVALDRLRALQSESFVDRRLAGCIGVAFDLDVDVLRSIRLELSSQAIDLLGSRPRVTPHRRTGSFLGPG